MSDWVVFLIAFACIAGGIALGVLLRRRIPAHHLTDEAKEVVRLGTGLIGTIAALVLGLLIASAKSSFDTQTNQFKQLTAYVILLDGLLANYGPEAAESRALIRREIAVMAVRIWRENSSPGVRAAPFELDRTAELLFQSLLKLAPASDEQRVLKERVLHASLELGKSRILLFVQEGNSVPIPFLTILVFWLTLIFASFSLFSQPNPLVIGSLLLFAMSAAGTIFLILELGKPYDGLLQISNEPLRNALPPLAR